MRKGIFTKQARRSHRWRRELRNHDKQEREMSKLKPLERSFLYRLAYTNWQNRKAVLDLCNFIKRRKISAKFIKQALEKNCKYVLYRTKKEKVNIRELLKIALIRLDNFCFCDDTINEVFSNVFNIPFRTRWITYKNQSGLYDAAVEDIVHKLSHRQFDSVDNISLTLEELGDSEFKLIEAIVKRFGAKLSIFKLFSSKFAGEAQIIHTFKSDWLGSKLTGKGERLKAILAKLPNAKKVEFTITDMFNSEDEIKKHFKF